MRHQDPTFPFASPARRGACVVLPAVLVVFFFTAMAAAHGGAVRVVEVHPGSAAEAAGLQAEDRIVELAGRKLASQDDLAAVIEAHQPGDAVALVVERGDETVELELVFGQRPDGGVSIGISLEVEVASGDDGAPVPNEGAVQCMAWIEETYNVSALLEDLDLDFAADYETIRACVTRDAGRMGSERVVRFCDNVFKVHCSGVDLLTEIGEAQLERCEERLGTLKPEEQKAWKTCAGNKVFDGYSMRGEAADESACRAALRDCMAEKVGWPRWGGPDQDFRAPAAGLAATWPEGGPEKLWRRPLGDGYSAIVAEDGRLYTMYGQKRNGGRTRCSKRRNALGIPLRSQPA